MTMLNHLADFAINARQAFMPVSPCYAVHLIDRRTGLPHVISGIPLVVYSRDPQETATDMMRNRDSDRWDVFIEPIKGALQ